MSTALDRLHRRLPFTLPRHHRPARLFTSATPKLNQQQPTPAPISRPPPRRGNSDQLPVLPLIAIFCLGSGSFYFLLKKREGVTHNTYTAGEKAPPSKDQWAGRKRDPTEQ